MVKELNRHTQRPYVGNPAAMVLENGTNDVVVQLVFQNFGNVPATEVKMTQQIFLSGHELKSYKEPAEDAIFPGMTVSMRSDMPWAMFERVKRGELLLEVKSKVDYSSFVGRHTTEVHLLHRRNFFTPKKVIVN